MINFGNELSASDKQLFHNVNDQNAPHFAQSEIPKQDYSMVRGGSIQGQQDQPNYQAASQEQMKV